MNLVINPKLQSEIDRFITRPTHALLLVGPLGSGKGALTNYISVKILGLDEAKLSKYPHFLRLQPEQNSISIDDVRKLHTFTSLKTPGSKEIRRIVVIEDLQTMTKEAQNAFLKLLEEPPADTLFVMAATDTNSLLPTVLSRVHQVQVLPPDSSILTDYFVAQGHGLREVTKALNIANCLPGLVAAILDSEDGHQLVAQIDNAKRLISGAMFERLIEVNNLSKDKDQLSVLLMALRKVVRAMLVQAVKGRRADEISKWHRVLSEIVETESLLAKNPHPKLLLTNLFMNL